jgi:hypothetical protein
MPWRQRGLRSGKPQEDHHLVRLSGGFWSGGSLAAGTGCDRAGFAVVVAVITNVVGVEFPGRTSVTRDLSHTSPERATVAVGRRRNDAPVWLRDQPV